MSVDGTVNSLIMNQWIQVTFKACEYLSEGQVSISYFNSNEN